MGGFGVRVGIHRLEGLIDGGCWSILPIIGLPSGQLYAVEFSWDHSDSADCFYYDGHFITLILSICDYKRSFHILVST